MNRPFAHLVDSRVSALAPYKPKPRPRIALDANESPDLLSAEARASIARALSEIDYHRYPDAQASALKEALAVHLGTSADRLTVGCGSDEIITLLYLCLGTGGTRTVLIPDPTFVMFEHSAITHGLNVTKVPLRPDFSLDTDAVIDRVYATAPNLVMLASPNNPTGNGFREEDLCAVIEAAEQSLVVLDEAYGNYRDGNYRSLIDRYDNVCVLGTLSKIGLAAARLGWVVGRPELMAELDKVRQPYNLSVPSQLVGQLALTTLWPELERGIDMVRGLRKRLSASLSTLPGVTPLPSDANFILTHLEQASEVERQLRTRGIGVRAFTHPRLTEHLRITVGNEEENDALVQAMRELLAP